MQISVLRFKNVLYTQRVKMSLRDLKRNITIQRGVIMQMKVLKKYFISFYFLLICLFTYVCSYHMARVTQNSWPSKAYILIGN